MDDIQEMIKSHDKRESINLAKDKGRWKVLVEARFHVSHSPKTI